MSQWRTKALILLLLLAMAPAVIWCYHTLAAGIQEWEIQRQEAELSLKFSVSFAQAGEVVTTKHDASAPGGQRNVTAREPTLDELRGVKAALYHSQPSQLLKGNAGIRFIFLSEPTLGYAAYCAEDSNGKPAIFIEQGMVGNPGSCATSDEAAKQHPNGTPYERRSSMESMLDHELAHYGQDRIGWNSGNTETDLAQKFGWVPYINHSVTPAETGYLFKDRSGNLYKYWSQSGGKPDIWAHCNQQGQPIVGSDNCFGWLSNDDMRARALVPPVSWYFVNPCEMYAEGMMFFRLSAYWRTFLLTHSPALYQVIKAEDQVELDGAYGQGKYIRMPDGQPGSDTPANRKIVSDFETSR